MFNKLIQVHKQKVTKKVPEHNWSVHVLTGMETVLGTTGTSKTSKFQEYFVSSTDIKQRRIYVTVQCYFTVYEAVVFAAIRQWFTKVHKTGYQQD